MDHQYTYGTRPCEHCGARLSSRIEQLRLCWSCQHPPCCVCLSPLLEGDTLVLGCGHGIHHTCLRRLRAYGILLCPLCRALIGGSCASPRDADYVQPGWRQPPQNAQQAQAHGEAGEAPPRSSASRRRRRRRRAAASARRQIRQYAAYLSEPEQHGGQPSP